MRAAAAATAATPTIRNKRFQLAGKYQPAKTYTYIVKEVCFRARCNSSPAVKGRFPRKRDFVWKRATSPRAKRTVGSDLPNRWPFVRRIPVPTVTAKSAEVRMKETDGPVFQVPPNASDDSIRGVFLSSPDQTSETRGSSQCAGLREYTNFVWR